MLFFICDSVTVEAINCLVDNDNYHFFRHCVSNTLHAPFYLLRLNDTCAFSTPVPSHPLPTPFTDGLFRDCLEETFTPFIISLRSIWLKPVILCHVTLLSWKTRSVHSKYFQQGPNEYISLHAECVASLTLQESVVIDVLQVSKSR